MTEAVTERLERTSGRGLAPGDLVLDRYRIVEWIGSGSYGLVMRAFDEQQQRVVAIKIRHSEIEVSRKDNHRFLRETRAVAALHGEHVTRLLDYGALPDGTPYMVMEHLEGLDLRKVLAKQGKLEASLAVDYVLQVCDALAEAHALGIIHRDIKPANLMRTRRKDGSELIKVLDFGCAKAPGMEVTQTGSLVGTPAYMSPEQMRTPRAVDARSDIWSVGALLYRLVEGRPPFDAKHFIDLLASVESERPPAMVAAPQLAAVVDRCLKKAPHERYASVVELSRDLAPFSSRPSMVPEAVSNHWPARSGSVRPRVLVLVGGAVAIAIGVTLAIATSRRDVPASRERDVIAPAATQPVPAEPPPIEPAPTRPGSTQPPPAEMSPQAGAATVAPPGAVPASGTAPATVESMSPASISGPTVATPEPAAGVSAPPTASVTPTVPPPRRKRSAVKRPSTTEPPASRNPDRRESSDAEVEAPCDPLASPHGC